MNFYKRSDEPSIDEFSIACVTLLILLFYVVAALAGARGIA
jgi:hypothetical protein